MTAGSTCTDRKLHPGPTFKVQGYPFASVLVESFLKVMVSIVQRRHHRVIIASSIRWSDDRCSQRRLSGPSLESRTPVDPTAWPAASTCQLKFKRPTWHTGTQADPPPGRPCRRPAGPGPVPTAGWLRVRVIGPWPWPDRDRCLQGHRHSHGKLPQSREVIVDPQASRRHPAGIWAAFS